VALDQKLKEERLRFEEEMKLMEIANKNKRRFKSSRTLSIMNNLGAKAEKGINGDQKTESNIETGNKNNSSFEMVN
jgi:hypothetical protein